MAALMLKDFVDLAPGDWVAQNVANSGVGRMLIAFARDKVASYKVPKQVRFIDEVPKSPVGKLLRRAVRDPFWQGRERKI